MMEIPYGWWVTVAFWCFIEGAAETRANVRTRWHLAMAVPIGAAMLTKSVLGLVPMMAIPVALLLSRDLRRRCGAAMWAGLALGAAIGASWPLQQWMRYGPVALQQHFLGQVLGPSTQQMGLMSRLIGYPIILVRSFEPIVWPALAGVIVWERRWWRERNHTTRTRNTPTAVDARMHPVPAHAPSLAAGKGDGRHRDAQDGDGWERDWRGAVLIAWLVVPIVIASASSAQSSRYIFPILVPLALLAARWLLDVVPRVAVFVTRVFAPALSCVVAASLWIQPSLLTRDQNRVLKMEAQRLQQEIAPTATVSFIGTRYWRVANPFTFYVDRWLNPLETPADVCKDTTIAYLFVETGQADRLKRECPVSGPTILTSPDWILMKIEQRPRP
jgi:4-amino-4-deoxy-L-arabinose transferase-like glycosyltransferase